MRKNTNIISQIQKEKGKDIARQELQPLNPEGKKMAEHKRFTFDIIGTPIDPLR